jgi:hypothetical protein
VEAGSDSSWLRWQGTRRVGNHQGHLKEQEETPLRKVGPYGSSHWIHWNGSSRTLLGHDVHQVVISRTIWRAFPSLVTDLEAFIIGYHCRRGGAGGSAPGCHPFRWLFPPRRQKCYESHSPLVSLRDHGNDRHLLGQDRNSRKIAYDCRHGFASHALRRYCESCPMIVPPAPDHDSGMHCLLLDSTQYPCQTGGRWKSLHDDRRP